jgi:AcrR family transcriptional regulator
MGTSSPSRPDGRIQRSERSRTSIVQAMLELIGEGSLAPTAQQVAERADVGVRTVFRHFSDMETLIATMNEQLSKEVESLFVDEVQKGPFDERVDLLIERRMEIFATIAPYLRSSSTQRWRSKFLQKEHERTTRLLRVDLRRWLPEVESFPRDVAELLELVLSFEAVNRLKTEQRLGLRRTAAVLRRAIFDLTKTHTSTR